MASQDSDSDVDRPSETKPNPAVEAARVEVASVPGSPVVSAATLASSTGSPAAASPGAPRKRYKQDFNFGKVLGEGSFGQVIQATDIETGNVYAIKIVSKEHVAREDKIKYVTTERDLLDLCKHPHIIKLSYTFSDKENLYFVMELAPNGEILTWLRRLSMFDIATTRFYAAEMVAALEFIHNLNVIHRDLKPENILLSESFHIKLTDFGTAKRLVIKEGDDASRARSNSFLGTAEYVSPELLKDKYTCKSSDLWSLGCIIYQFLLGKMPFHAATDYLIFQRIQKCDVIYPDEMNEQAKDLLQKILVLDPDARLGAGEGGYAALKAHPFFTGVDWEGLSSSVAPDLSKLVPPPRATPAPAPVSAEAADRARQLELQKSSRWYAFVTGNELIIKDGSVSKKRSVISAAKKRILVLTDQPRLFYLDATKPDAPEQKGVIPMTAEMRVELPSASKFNIVVPGRTYNFTSDVASEWADAINSQLARAGLAAAGAAAAPASPAAGAAAAPADAPAAST